VFPGMRELTLLIAVEEVESFKIPCKTDLVLFTLVGRTLLFVAAFLVVAFGLVDDEEVPFDCFASEPVLVPVARRGVLRSIFWRSEFEKCVDFREGEGFGVLVFNNSVVG